MVDFDQIDWTTVDYAALAQSGDPRVTVRKDGSALKHAPDCPTSGRFGRLSPADCAACAESAWAKRAGVTLDRSHAGVDAKRRQHADDQERARAIRAHDCTLAKCGPVCTFGDW